MKYEDWDEEKKKLMKQKSKDERSSYKDDQRL